MKKIRAFTLIELLIVVAIIAILAAIAVPNFLEAQVRSKVARAKTDLRSVSLAIEAYLVDNNTIPPDGNDSTPDKGVCTAEAQVMRQDSATITPAQQVSNPGGLVFRVWHRWKQFTTPIAYMTSPPTDPFSSVGVLLSYETWAGIAGTPWKGKPVFCVTTSWGPTKAMSSAYNFPNCIYDPTNGTVSSGNMFRIAAIKDADYARNRFGPSFDFLPH